MNRTLVRVVQDVKLDQPMSKWANDCQISTRFILGIPIQVKIVTLSHQRKHIKEVVEAELLCASIKI